MREAAEVFSEFRKAAHACDLGVPITGDGLVEMQRGVQSTKAAAENQHTVLFGIILLLTERTEKPRKDQSAYQTDERTKQREPKSHVGIFVCNRAHLILSFVAAVALKFLI